MAAPAPDRWSDEAIEATVGRLLQAGVMVAAALVLVGGLRYLAHHGATTCTEANPHCRVCPIRETCPEGRGRMQKEE